MSPKSMNGGSDRPKKAGAGSGGRELSSRRLQGPAEAPTGDHPFLAAARLDTPKDLTRRARLAAGTQAGPSASSYSRDERTSSRLSGNMSSGRNSSGGDGVASSSKSITAQNKPGQSTSGVPASFLKDWRFAIRHETEARRPRRRKKLASWSASSPSVTLGRRQAARTQPAPVQRRCLLVD